MNTSSPISTIKLITAVIILSFSSANLLRSQTISFPGAEGYGRFSKGGRGGDVYIVTNLNDDGAGSLRYGVENADGPRTIVFEVSGNIELKSHLTVETSYMTIAGQTAPGDGICIKDYGFKIMDCHDIIVRYMRFRLGDENKEAPAGYDAIETNGVSNIIFDHVSASWGIDGIHDLRGELFTLQWSIYGEALNNSLHEKGNHAMLSSMRDVTDNLTMHHNLMHSSRDRHPTLGGGTGTKAESIIDFRNNVVFNWEGGTNLGSCKLNVINNYYKPGASTDLPDQPMNIKSEIGVGDPKGFTSGNVFPWNQAWTEDNFLAINYEKSGKYISTTREAWELPGELVFGDDRPGTQSAEEAYDLVLLHAGASLSRDSADTRIVRGIKDGTNRLIDSQKEVGGFPVLSSLPAPADSDRDGMPDDWEAASGLDSLNADDRNGDRNLDGFTNLEEYLYSLVPVLTDVKPVVKIISPLSNTGYLQQDTVFVKVIAQDYGDGKIESLQVYLDEDLISSLDLPSLDTTLTGLAVGKHFIIARTIDDSGNLAVDTSKIYIGTRMCSLAIDSIVGGGTVEFDPPGGIYLEGMEVSMVAIPSFPFQFEEWTGDLTGSQNPVMVTMLDDVSLSARFVMDSISVVNINFQPASSPVPPGYIPDYGYEYGLRDEGHRYGWVTGPNNETRDRGKPDDPRKSTLNHMYKNGMAIWEFGLPDGFYDFHIFMGDASNTDQDNSINLEGIDRMDPTPNTGNFDEYYFENVEVNDGRLTITPLIKPKIIFIKIGLIGSAFGKFLLVRNGSGTGEYHSGDLVEIAADEPEDDYIFHSWTGDSAYITDPAAIISTLDMPDVDITVAASYLSLIKKLTVRYGSGSGEYIEGEVITITAESPPAGKLFDKWTGDTAGIADIKGFSTTITIGKYDQSVTATYRDYGTGLEPDASSEKKITCYPNPAGSSFTLDLNGIGSCDVEIFNLLGRLVYNTRVLERISNIQDHNLPAGIYILKARDIHEGIYTQKLIIESD